MMKMILNMIAIFITAAIGFIAIAGTLFLNYSPQFGAAVTKEQKNEFAKSGYFQNGRFINRIPSPMDISYWKLFKEFLQVAPDRNPCKNIDVVKIDSSAFEKPNAEVTRLYWFGHSTFLLEIDGKKILIDPMLSQTPAPHLTYGLTRGKEVYWE